MEVYRGCNNTKSVTGNAFVGGIIGYSGATSKITYFMLENCNNSGEITSTGSAKNPYYQMGATKDSNVTYTGGIIGLASRTKITEASNTGEVYGTNSLPSAVGGIIGEIRNGDITKCYNQGQIGRGTGNSTGGIVGLGIYNVNLNNCYNTGIVKGDICASGIIGYASQANIRYCYNTADISGKTEVGGIVGGCYDFYKADYTNSYIMYCYSIGNITGSTRIGAIVGVLDYYNIDNVYYLQGNDRNYYGDTRASYQAGSNIAGVSKTDLISNVLSKFGENFKSDTANINNGYPILSWQ